MYCRVIRFQPSLLCLFQGLHGQPYRYEIEPFRLNQNSPKSMPRRIGLGYHIILKIVEPIFSRAKLIYCGWDS